MKHSRAIVVVLSVAILLCAPSLWAKKKHGAKQNGDNVEVTASDASAHVKAFSYSPKKGSLTIDGTTVPLVFEDDGSVTFNGVNCKTNDAILAAIASSGMATVTAEEIDGFLEMLNTGEVKINPPKRGEAFVQLLRLWRSKL